MRIKGKLLKCDRCGKIAFLKYLGKQEQDVGYSRSETFENDPAGWSHVERMDLCDECSDEWNQIMKNFMIIEKVKEYSRD